MDFLGGINVQPKYRPTKIVKKQELSIKKIRLYAIVRPDNFRLATMPKRKSSIIQLKDRAFVPPHIQ